MAVGDIICYKVMRGKANRHPPGICMYFELLEDVVYEEEEW